MSSEPRLLTILAVDDEPIILLGTVSMLERMGHTVISAHSGRAALAMLASDPTIAALVTDQSMPDLSGAELIAAARQLDRPIACVLTTGHPEMGATAASDWVHVVKPFSSECLAAALQRALSLVGVRSAPLPPG
jgi:CheY-like chemotaxis protein